MTVDELYMRRCLQLAAQGIEGARPNPMVGAVIVAPADVTCGDKKLSYGDNFVTCRDNFVTRRDNFVTRRDNFVTCSDTGGRIIGEGYHVRYGEGHAEVNAFASVSAADEALLPQSTMYVSLEPCAHYGKTPPCADLIVAKGVRRVVIGTEDPFAKVHGRGIEKLRAAGIEVTVGVLPDECWWLNRRFFTYHEKQRPYIILKWAQTANGFIDDGGRPLQISNRQTQMLSHKLRAEEDAILVGHTTAEREQPRLDVRHWHGRNPARIVLTRQRPLPMLIGDLYQQGIQSLIVEGGLQTHESFLEAGLWDEVRVETSTATVAGGTRAPQLPSGVQIYDRKIFGDNTVCCYRRKREEK